MSYNQPFRKSQDDFSASRDTYADPQRMYQRESGAYRSRIRSMSPEQSASSSDLSALPPGKALSFLHSCGLDAEDLQTLAELPEHLISAEKLPDLLNQIKKKKSIGASSSRAGTLQQSSLGRSWENRSNTRPYLLETPVRESYSCQQEQGKTWEDRWGNAQKTTSETSAYTRSDPNYLVEYNHLKDKEFVKPSFAAESKQKTTPASQSYSNYSRADSESSYLSGRDVGQSSHLSGRDVGQSSHLSGRDVRQSLHLSSRDVSQSSHLSSRDVGQSSHLSSRDVVQSSFLSSRDVGQTSRLSTRDVHQPSSLSTRDIGQPLHQSTRDIGQPSHQSTRDLSSRYLGQPLQISSRNIVYPEHLQTRDLGQPSHLSARDIGLPSHLTQSTLAYLSAKNINKALYLYGKDGAQAMDNQRVGSIDMVPTRKEASDFHGKTPPVFPYACVLCEITVLSNKDWSVHIKGPQHANSQLNLVERYPHWNQKIHSARRNDTRPLRLKAVSERDRTGSGTSKRRSELSSSKNSSEKVKSSDADECKTVCVKFGSSDVDEPYLRQLLGQFGAIVKFVSYPKMAFVEMGSKDQALDIIKYFLHNPLKVNGKRLEFSMCAVSTFLQTCCVVSFSPLPNGEGIHSEIIAIAKRFGSLKHSQFVPNRAYLEMSSAQEAAKLVEHYSTNSLKLKGKTIQVSYSTEHTTLRSKDADKEESSSRRRRSSSKRSPSRRHHRDSPSPKRRERSSSHRSTDSKKEGERKSSSKESSRRASSSKSRSKTSPSSKDKSKETDKSAKKTTDAVKDETATACDDSDLEGVAVIADDCEELGSDEDFYEIDYSEEEDEEQEEDSSAAMNELDVSEDVNVLDNNEISSDGCKEAKEDNQELQHNQDQIEDTNMDISEESNESQELQQNQDAIKKETSDEIGDATLKLLDGSTERKQAEELQQNQDAPKDETVEMTDRSSECKIEKVLQEHQEAQKDETHGLMEKDDEKLAQIQESDNVSDMDIEDQNEEVDENLLDNFSVRDAEELQQIQEAPKDETVEPSDGLSDKKTEELQQNQDEPVEIQAQQCQLSQAHEDEKEVMEQESSEYPVNLESCITADESEEMTKQGDEQKILTSEEMFGRVLEVKGFPFAKKYSEDDLVKIGQKYGEVANCCLVRNNRKVEKALIEMRNADDACKLEAAAKRQNLKLGGKILRITVSDIYRQIKERVIPESDSGKTEDEKIDSTMQTSSDEEEPYGKVLRIRNLPLEEFTNADFLNIVEQFGKVKRHWLDRPHCMGFIEMETETDAEKVVAAANMNKITIAGTQPKITVSKKHSNLNKRYFLCEPSIDSQPTPTELEKENDESETQKPSDEPETTTKDTDIVSDMNEKLSESVGTEFVRPVVGYFCNLCNIIYASEEEAKNEHCRTVLHHQKLKEHMDQKSST